MMDDYEMIAEKAKSITEELKDMSHYIHDNPELGLKEHKACNVQVELLKRYGFEVEKGMCGFDTAYKAVFSSDKKGPKIAMLSEYDALPGLGHACGHNLISMVSTGSGILIKDLVKKYGGAIYVIGTPAEETHGTKVDMAREGVFDDIDVVMMAHPIDGNYDSMNTNAIIGYKFSFYGKSAHAAASPETGINALDAVINFFNMINAMRQQIKPDARIHGIITDGGRIPNVIPDYSEAIVCVRANKCTYMNELADRLIECAKGAALGTGTKLEYAQYNGTFKDTMSNMTLSNIQTEQMEKLGVKVIRMNGAFAPGSSDLGDVSYICPSIQVTFCITEGKPCGAHTKEFAEYANTDQAMNMGIKYAVGFAMTAKKILTDHISLEKIKAEFTKNVSR